MFSILVQFALLAVGVELFVVCMPRVLRRKSNNNCYRFDGTRSGHRAYRERMGRNRLRLNMLAVLGIVFLSGNALYWTIDSRLGINVLKSFSNYSANPGQRERDVLAQELRANHRPSLPDVDQSIANLKRSVPGLAVAGVGWLLVSAALIAVGAMRAYRELAAGIGLRSTEYFNVDMNRMSLTENELAAHLLSGTAQSVTRDRWSS